MPRLAELFRFLMDGVLVLLATSFLIGLLAGVLAMLGPGSWLGMGPRRRRALAGLDHWLNAEADRGDEILRRERSRASGYRGDA